MTAQWITFGKQAFSNYLIKIQPAVSLRYDLKTSDVFSLGKFFSWPPVRLKWICQTFSWIQKHVKKKIETVNEWTFES